MSSIVELACKINLRPKETEKLKELLFLTILFLCSFPLLTYKCIQNTGKLKAQVFLKGVCIKCTDCIEVSRDKSFRKIKIKNSKLKFFMCLSKLTWNFKAAAGFEVVIHGFYLHVLTFQRLSLWILTLKLLADLSL